MNFKAESRFAPVDTSRLMQRIIPALQDAVTEGCGAVVEEARALCPVDTGALQSSIRTTGIEIIGQGVVGHVSATESYASFVEYGTGLVGQANPHPPLPAAGIPYTGGWVYDFRRQNWKGEAARAFMRPGLDAARPRIVSAFADRGFRA